MGPVVLLQLGTKLLSIPHVTKSYVNICGLLPPEVILYLWPRLPLGNMLVSVACTAPGDHAMLRSMAHADSRGLVGGCPWSMLKMEVSVPPGFKAI